MNIFLAIICFSATYYECFARTLSKLESDFFDAVKSSDKTMVESLLRQGVNIDVGNVEENLAPLHFAADKGNVEMTELLIRNGANVNHKGIYHATPLLYAAWPGYQEVVETLIKNGADVNAIAYLDRTSLHYAAIKGHEKMAEFLIKNGANTNARTQENHTPLHYAAENGYDKIVELLIRNGADVNARRNGNLTPLHEAAMKGREKIVDLLLQNNADLSIKDKDGKTPISLANEKGFTKIGDLLTKSTKVSQAACKIYSTTVTDRILGGQLSKSDEFAWMAALGYLNHQYKISFDCGGTIISDFFILTAAHCASTGHRPVVVRLGKLSLTDEGTTRTENREIDSIVTHPNYSSTWKINDIALIRVTQRIWFTEHIRPACLHTDLKDENPDVKLVVTGWGIISLARGVRSDILRKTDLVTMSLSQCNTTLLDYNKKSNQRAFRNGISESQYCAYDPEGKNDSCQGDSGGPLQIITNDSRTAKIVGIVSFGVSCGTTLPSIYTRVAYYIYWIESHVWPNGEVSAPLDSSENLPH